MEEKQVFDLDRVNAGFSYVGDAMDTAELTLFERWWVSRCYERAAASMLGGKLGEIAEKWSEKLPELREKADLLESYLPVEAVAVDRVGDGGDYADDEPTEGPDHGSDA